ncbi:MAG: bifunctional UDP-3-O-[3-hydroxymyristoyl] N-acetylglucosamine deacetylase/3-hydroxyacyl-ACP dehydratase [Verrucomicrobia bacterium]|nr:bifunctional UDP-3-O-[3-hydroxymyristoyl] N-acetylglucosamine deacetylase/3-hydroxyacyl-ACP dehydratase [Verrucomicrobiota bacterium]
MVERQRTIQREISHSGIGVHTGNKSRITFKPAPPNHGVKFVRTDMDEPVVIEAVIDNVSDVVRGTTIASNGVKIHTVEHVLAALMGFGIDNLVVEVDANEPPVGDGSSLPFVRMLEAAGLEEQDAPKCCFTPREPIHFSEDGITIVVLPSDALRLSATISYERTGLDSQYCSLPITTETFVKEIAPSRTFCFYHEVEHLMRNGLIKGGSLDNAVVIKDEAILTKEGLRFPNEFVRHKILDLMGDLYLLGRPLRAHVIAIKSGHVSHIKLTRLLRERIAMTESTKSEAPGVVHPETGEVFDIGRIMRILPHRYPFLLVDRIVQIEPGRRIVGLKNVTINEPFFTGHFPEQPIMPGVLIVEAMAQAGAILLLTASGNDGRIVYFASVDKCRFRRPVMPGDQLRLEAEAVAIRGKIAKMKAAAYVGDEKAAEAELMCSLADA